MEEVFILEFLRCFSSFWKKVLFFFDVYFLELGVVIELIFFFIMIRGVYNENFFINFEGLLFFLFEVSFIYFGEVFFFVI